MRLNSFHVEKLHGFLSIPIIFNDDLTVILGINGSGKTSALTLMAALLRLDLAAVTQMKFQSATLAATSGDGDPILIQASSNGARLELTLEIDGSVHKLSDATLSNNSVYLRSMAEFTPALSLEHLLPISDLHIPYIYPGNKVVVSDELVAAKKFVAQARLTFVQLDRTIVAIDPDGEEAIERLWKSSGTKKSKPLEPISEVLRVTKQKYLEYKSASEAIRDHAYRESLRLHFDSIGNSNRAKIDRASLTRKLASMKTQVSKSALTSNESGLKLSTEKFFQEFEALLVELDGKDSPKRLGRRTLGEEQLDAILTVKHQQIERLLTIFEQEARATQEAYAPIRRYLNVVNKFFRESGKRLSFDSNYELGFTIDDLSDGNDVNMSAPRSLKELSSGERQILIILTYLAFVSGKDSVFVIDEPELSLHLVWQRLLVEAVTQLRPHGCQVVLATHAPEIAGRALEKITRLERRFVR